MEYQTNHLTDSRGDLTSQVSMKPLTKPDDHFHELESQLAFPAFHPEILQQPRWDPAEPMGRIQVVLTEGILRLPRTTQPGVGKVSFTGLRDVVAFAFQHAPQGLYLSPQCRKQLMRCRCT